MARTRIVAIAAAACAFLAAATPTWAAVSATLGGSTLNVNLTAANDIARVTTSGANIQVIDDGSSTLVFAVPAASVDTMFAQGNSAGGQVVRLDGTLSFPGGVNVLAVDQLVHQGDYDVGAGGYVAEVAVSIVLATGTGQVAPIQRISSTTGQIFLGANLSGTTTSGSVGIQLLGATVTTGTGQVTLFATGGNAAASDDGVEILSGSTISSTGTGAGAENIFINGTGGAGSGGTNTGVLVQNSTITSIDRTIDLQGMGGQSAGTGNSGVVIGAGSSVAATGAATVVFFGQGGGMTTSDSNHGIVLASAGSITGTNGDVGLEGVAGVGSSSNGIATLTGGGTISTTGTAGIFLFADSLTFTAPTIVDAGTSEVTFLTVLVATPISLGTKSSGHLGLLNSELAMVTASKLLIGRVGYTGGIAVTGTITNPATWSTLSLLGSGAFSGPGTLQVPALEITDSSSTGHSWSLAATSIQEGANSAFHPSGTASISLTGGTGSDTFNVTPSAATAFTIDGNTPAPPTVPGDTLNVATGATSPSLTYTSTGSGFQGTETFGNAQTVTFSHIESGTVAPTHFSVSAPATAQAGVPFSFTVTALDGANNTASGYSGTVHFTSSDGSATLPADATLVNGVATFGATLVTLGSQTITATDTVALFTGTSASISVGPGSATHFSVSAPATATSGSAFSFTVTAFDQFNNTATGYAGTVQFSSTDGTAVLPANSTLASGVGTFSATLKTAGNQTITATDTVASPITGTSNSIAVSAAAATHFAVSAPASATAGNAFTFTVTALDAFNNTATAYAGTVHFTSSDGQAVLPADSTLTSGVGTFSATLKTAGGQTITATDTVTPSIAGTSGTVTVAAGPATHFTVSAPAQVTLNGAFSFTVTALDAFNNTASGYAGNVAFTGSDALEILPAVSTLAAGAGTFSATLKTLGTQTITATDNATSSITGTSASILVTSNIFSGPSATGTGTITASFTGGGATCSFSGPQFIGSPPGSPPVPPSLPAPGVLFPQGMFDFSLVGCAPGSTINFTITYPESVASLKYYKYGPEVSNPTPHWYVMPAAISGNTITFSITDGGKGDDDYTANGIIVDQGGPGGGAGPSIPTLDWRMLLLLAAMLLVTAASIGNKRQR